VRPILLIVALAATAAAQDQGPTAKPFAVVMAHYAFDPPRLEVNQDDLVKIELRAGDIAHSMTIDAYRIAKRVDAGRSVTFEFRADRAGTFPYYCNLQIDDRCRRMRGELVVKPKTR
jgi:heme/copper-type cytochrome/quinol oxidase subunit 2